MNAPNPHANRKIVLRPRLGPAVAIAVPVAAALFIWWTVRSADRQMRAELLRQVILVGKGIDAGQLQLLSGSEADLASPEYLRLKEYLVTVRTVERTCRFAYLLRRQADGTVVFLADSEPVESEDYSYPGQVYDEAPAGFRRAFDSRAADVEGPFKDRWGTWISALAPLTDPGTQAVVAVLAMDVDAGTWKRDAAARSTVPVTLTLALVVLLVAGKAGAMPGGKVSARPILHRLMVPITASLLLVLASLGAVIVTLQNSRLDESSRQVVKETLSDFSQILAEQSRSLAALEDVLAHDTKLCQALAAGDRERLLADYLPVFEQLKNKYAVNHFYLSDPQRVCIVRIHQPDKYGDRLERFTALDAERTGRISSGIELGPLGTFTLRVVRPIFNGETLVGYLELGKEIEDILAGIHRASGVGLAVAIHKSVLKRPDWETGMKLLGRPADWDRYRDDVLVYSTLAPFPAEVERFLSHPPNTVGDVAAETAIGRRLWRVTETPLRDVSGAEKGELVVVHDLTDARMAYRRLLSLVAGGMLAFLATLLGFQYVILRRTDAGIRAQQAELRASEERLSATLRSIGDGVIACDGQGNIVNLNTVGETLTGWTGDEARGRPIAEIFRIVHAETRESAEIPVDRALREDRIIGLANHTVLIARDGTERQIADSCAPIHSVAGAVIGAVLVFRDVTEEYRQREALRETSHRLALAVRAGGVGIWDYDIVENRLVWDDQMFRLYGITRSQFREAYEGWKAGVHPQDRQRADEEIRQALCGEKDFDTEFRVIWPDESVHSIRALGVVQRNAGGMPVRMIGTNWDITSRRQAEQELRENKRRLDIAMEGAELGAWHWDIAGGRRHFSDRSCRLLGIDPAAFGGTNDEFLSVVL
ncbi:MAG: PAS domain-containing protein, partial [Thermoguttaceae bacterium]